MSIIKAYKKQDKGLEEKFNVPLNKKMWYHEKVLNILQERLDNEIVKELEKIYLKAKEEIRL